MAYCKEDDKLDTTRDGFIPLVVLWERDHNHLVSHIASFTSHLVVTVHMLVYLPAEVTIDVKGHCNKQYRECKQNSHL